MSWIEQAQNNIIIVTGDGREYKPLWKEPRKVIEYNISQFDFPGVEGSFVSRGTPKGRKFPLEIYFTGENHLDEVARFEISASDPRHWVVTHPYYGIINVQPVSINIDNTAGNVSKMDINLIETIVDDNPKGIETPSEKILLDGVTLTDRIVVSFTTQIPTPGTLDKNLISSQAEKVYNEGKKKITNTIDANNYTNLFNDASAAILDATDDAAQAMTTLQAMINAPFQFVDTVKNRIITLKNQFDKLTSSIENIASFFSRSNDKRIYEHISAGIIGAMAQAAVTNIDYESAADVLSTAETLLETYDDFVADIDELQTDNGGDEDSYIPDAEAMIKLQEIIDYTVSKLLEIALDSKQERSIVLETDSNVVLLAHRLYGLQPDDSTIEYLIRTNNFGLNELLQVTAGQRVKYYI